MRHLAVPLFISAMRLFFRHRAILSLKNVCHRREGDAPVTTQLCHGHSNVVACDGLERNAWIRAQDGTYWAHGNLWVHRHISPMSAMVFIICRRKRTRPPRCQRPGSTAHRRRIEKKPAAMRTAANVKMQFDRARPAVITLLPVFPQSRDRYNSGGVIRTEDTSV